VSLSERISIASLIGEYLAVTIALIALYRRPGGGEASPRPDTPPPPPPPALSPEGGLIHGPEAEALWADYWHRVRRWEASGKLSPRPRLFALALGLIVLSTIGHTIALVLG
jgi:hypothetical protein